MAVTTEQAGATAIRSFQTKVAREEIDDLRQRLQATRRPGRETVADETQGVQLATMRKLVRHWGTE